MVYVGETIRYFDPDRRKIVSAIVTRIASNGIRAELPGYGIVSAKVQIGGVWGNEEDRVSIRKIIGVK